MTTVIKEISVPGELDREIAREAGERGKSWSAIGEELLLEAIKLRRVSGIVFDDGPGGRRAVVAGTGLDVWELIATWKACGEDDKKLRQSYPWMTEPQRRAAIRFYRLYPQEIEERLERERQWTPEKVRRELPFSNPERRK